MYRALVVLVPCAAVAAMACESSPRGASPEEKASVVANSATAVVLGTTQSFAVLAGSTVTNTGPTVVTGALGVSPGSAVTGFPPGLVNGGTIQAGTAVALKAQNDATTAYNALAGQACDHDLTGRDMGGLTLTPGTYCFSSSAQLTGTLTLNAEGDPAAVFVFQIGSTLTAASSSSVRVINGGDSCNVYWQVGSSATIGTGSTFMGSIIALTSITLSTGVAVSGRALARNAAVTMDTDTVSAASCQVGLDGGGTEGGAGGTGTGGSNATGGNAGVAGSAGSGAGGASGVGGVASAGGAAGPADSGVGGASGRGGAHGAGGVVGMGGVAGASGGGGADAGMTFCGNVCVDLQTDFHHCGSCDHVCGPSESCVNGMCTGPCPPSAMQPSCQGLAATCGPAGNASCCSSSVVPGGTYNRSNDVNYPATVSDFRFDTYEVTVGRFRKFKAAWEGGWRPSAGAGKHKHLNGGRGLVNSGAPGYESGWETAWDSAVTPTDPFLSSCGPSYTTWTSSPGANENRPINCTNWYEQYAFCIWDGGFLPSEAEWNYAAAGGNEQRSYPWGDTAPDCTFANYKGAAGDTEYCTLPGIGATNDVGSESPKGDGKWGQADLAGNVLEWTLDSINLPYAQASCPNCAYTVASSGRVLRGGSFLSPASNMTTSNRGGFGVSLRDGGMGSRCARSP